MVWLVLPLRQPSPTLCKARVTCLSLPPCHCQERTAQAAASIGAQQTLSVLGELAASRNPAAQQSSDGYLLWVGWVVITGKLGLGEPRIGVASLLIDRVT